VAVLRRLGLEGLYQYSSEVAPGSASHKAACINGLPQSPQNGLSHQSFLPGLSPRGPDSNSFQKVELGDSSSLFIAGSVLQLRGEAAVPSPLLDDRTGHILAFNGEVFGGLHVSDGQNDSTALFGALLEATSVPLILSQLRGPWALVYWQARDRRLWFGRDVLGRRSLLVHWPDRRHGRLLLSSVEAFCSPSTSFSSPSSSTKPESTGEGADSEAKSGDGAVLEKFWQELTPGLYSITFEAEDGLFPTCCFFGGAVLQHHPWVGRDGLDALEAYRRPHNSLAPPHGPDSLPSMGDNQSVTDKAAWKRHALSVCPSGGEPGKNHRDYQWPPARQLSPDVQPYISDQLQLTRAAETVLASLGAAVAVRCCCDGSRVHTPYPSATASPSPLALPAAKVAVLFSGGVDSTLLAALTHQALPPGHPVDLINVCFDNGKSPDRLAAHDALQELAAFAPDRPWRLVEVNRTLEDVDRHKKHILMLLEPAGTVMDINIGAALWMAAGGVGRAVLAGTWDSQPSASEPAVEGCCPAASREVRSAARVLLLGHGADEQCAGYGRHQTKFWSSGWQGLQEELCLDMQRLWLRNLGRDDRLVCISM